MKTKTSKVILISVVSAIGIVFLTLFIMHRIKISDFNQKLEQSIGKDEGLTETILKSETESASMTYQELFDLCDKSIDERTNIIVDLRGLYPELESKLKDSLIKFLNSENELIRQKNQFYRKSLNVSSSLDEWKEHREDEPSYYSDYGWDYYRQRSREISQDICDNALEMETETQQFSTTYKGLIEKEKFISKMMADENLRFIPMFDKYKQSNLSFADSSSVHAQAYYDLFAKNIATQ